MKRRIAAGFLALLLCLFVSVPSFASVASASEIGVSNDSVHNDISSLDDSSVSGVGMGDDAASSDETTSNDTLEDDSVDSGLDDTDTSFASGSIDASVVPTWQEAVDDVKAQRAVASASEVDLMTMDLTDDDYSVSPYSSVGTVTNTVDYSGCAVQVNYVLNGKSIWKFIPLNSDGTFSSILPDGAKLRAAEFYLYRTALPSSGKYNFSFDFSSDFSFDWDHVNIAYTKSVNNASDFRSFYYPSYQSLSGDVYISPFLLDLGSISRLAIGLILDDPYGDSFGGSVRFNFTQSFSSSNPDSTTPGVGAEFSEQDYQNGVTSGLSNIGDTLEEIVETISLQLEALWNQMYNYIHLPEYEKLEQIRQAIENIRLDVDVDNQDVVNKLDEQIKNDNANTQHVTNGYDKSTLDDTNTQLSDTFQAQEDQEQDIMEQISHPLDDFEFKNPITPYLSTFLLFGDFLQSLFVSSGAMADVINLSFVITIALMVVGLYRFKGGN